MTDIRPELIERVRDELAGCLIGGGDYPVPIALDEADELARVALEAVADDLRAEGAERAERAAVTLGKVLDRWAEVILDAGNSWPLVDETRDGDWEVIEERARNAQARALREAAVAMRSCKDPGHWNLRDPRDPEVSYSPDVWLETRADQIVGADQ